MSEQVEQLEMIAEAQGGALSNSPAGRIIVVDDEPELKNILVAALSAEGFDVAGFSFGHQALEELRQRDFDLLLTDLMMPEMDGIALLEAALQIDPQLMGIIMTGQGTIQTAVEAMKVGAFDYVLKPFQLQTVMPALTRAIGTRRLRLENLQLRETVAIYDLCQTIAFTLNPQTVIDKLADAAFQQTDADEVSVLLPTSDGRDELYVAAVRGEHRVKLLGERVPLEESISGWVAREREPLMLEGEINDDRFRSLWPHPEIRSAISIPMEAGNKLVGTININATSRLRPFTLGQMKALSILAGTAAAALESASAYAQVQRAEENYRSIFENAVEGVFQSTPDGRFLTANPAMARILGYDSPEELIANIIDVTLQLYVDPESRAEAARIEKERGILQGYEFEAYRKDGQKIWLSLNRRAVRDESGVEIYREGTVEDITERKHAEAAVKHAEEKYRSIFENAVEGIFQSTADGRFISVNPAMARILGYKSAEELMALRTDIGTQHYVDTGSRAELERMLAKQGVVVGYECEVYRKDLSKIWTVENVRAIRDEGGGVLCYEGSLEDITERKALAEQLRQSQKLEAIGMLAGGIAHDFNNLLTVISGYSDLTLRRLNSEDPLHCNISEVKKAAERAAGLTRQLLAFSRKQVLQPKVLDLNTVISELEKMLRRLIGEDVGLRTALEPDLSSIKADLGQIEQIVMNLAVNARDAMPQGGKLTIQTMNVYLDQDYAKTHVAVIPGPYVMLAVSDTGKGMDRQTQARIFEPFFTTKEAGKGTGLGLSTVYGIVKQSGGNIWVYSEVGKGTSFKVYLPRVGEGAPECKRKAATEGVVQGSETVLLAEDEEMVRRLARQVLETGGYQVLEAANGGAALLICERHKEPIHLLITDVIMPEMSGRELADRLAQLRPQLKVLYMSGYTDDAIVRQGVMDEAANFIQKPFPTDALVRKVREVLDAPKEPHWQNTNHASK